MTTYFQGYLPQGSSIVTEFNPEYTYKLEPSRTLTFPFKMRRYYNQVVVDLADTTPFESCFIPVIRCWPSAEPVGQSITAAPLASQATVNLGPSGVKWNFWLVDQLDQNNRSLFQEADIYHPIESDQTYWMNVQNLQNKTSYFWCRFTYWSPRINKYTE